VNNTQFLWFLFSYRPSVLYSPFFPSFVCLFISIFVPLFPSVFLAILFALYRFVCTLSYLSTFFSQVCAAHRQVPCRWLGAHVSRSYRLHTRQIAVSTDGRYRKPYCVASLFICNKMAAGSVWQLSPEPLEICVGVHEHVLWARPIGVATSFGARGPLTDITQFQKSGLLITFLLSYLIIIKLLWAENRFFKI